MSLGQCKCCTGNVSRDIGNKTVSDDSRIVSIIFGKASTVDWPDSKAPPENIEDKVMKLIRQIQHLVQLNISSRRLM